MKKKKIRGKKELVILYPVLKEGGKEGRREGERDNRGTGNKAKTKGEEHRDEETCVKEMRNDEGKGGGESKEKGEEIYIKRRKEKTSKNEGDIEVGCREVEEKKEVKKERRRKEGCRGRCEGGKMMKTIDVKKREGGMSKDGR